MQCIPILSDMSSVIKNLSSAFPTMSDTNRALQPRRWTRSLKFRIYAVEGLTYLCSENKGANQLVCGFVFAIAKIRFSHDMVHMKIKCEIFLESCLIFN